MKNLLKTFAVLIAVLTLIPATHALASQTVSSESEPNNSMSTANQVTRNLTTPAQAADGSFSGENTMKGSGTVGEDDWYSIYLSDNCDSYLSFIIERGLYDITVYDINNNIVGTNEYKSVSAKTIYNLDIHEDGIYYLQITCKVASSYKFMIGNPNYTVDWENISLGSLSLVNGTDYETYKDLTLNTDVPPRAIVYRISLNGGSSSSTKYRQVKPSSSNSWVDTSKYIWKSDLTINDSNKFHQKWDFKYIPAKTIAIDASVYFYYVYPVLPANETE